MHAALRDIADYDDHEHSNDDQLCTHKDRNQEDNRMSLAPEKQWGLYSDKMPMIISVMEIMKMSCVSLTMEQIPHQEISGSSTSVMKETTIDIKKYVCSKLSVRQLNVKCQWKLRQY